VFTARYGWNAFAQLVEVLFYKPEGRVFDYRWCHWNFSLTQFFRPHYGPGVASIPNRNITRNISCGGKSGRCVRLTLCHLHMPIVLKSGSLNLLEPSGPVKACNGIALPLPLHSVASDIGVIIILRNKKLYYK
jgi:hypothetical protein